MNDFIHCRVAIEIQRLCVNRRVARNNTFFTELEQALLALPSTRTAVGGNAPVMAKRFVEEGVGVTLGARMSLALKDQLNRKIAGYFTLVFPRLSRCPIHNTLDCDTQWYLLLVTLLA